MPKQVVFSCKCSQPLQTQLNEQTKLRRVGRDGTSSLRLCEKLFVCFITSTMWALRTNCICTWMTLAAIQLHFKPNIIQRLSGRLDHILHCSANVIPYNNNTVVSADSTSCTNVPFFIPEWILHGSCYSTRQFIIVHMSMNTRYRHHHAFSNWSSCRDTSLVSWFLLST